MKQYIKNIFVLTLLMLTASLNAWAYDDWTSTNTGSGWSSSSKTWDKFSVPAGKYVLVDYEVNGADKDYLYLNEIYNYSGSQNIYGKKSGTFVIYNEYSYSRTLQLNARFYRNNGGNGYAKVTNVRIADSAPKFTEITLKDTEELGVNTSNYINVYSNPLYASSNLFYKNVTLKSSNEKIAKVDANGKVTGVGAGTATITATATDGSGVSGSCKVTVKKTEKIDLSNTYIGINNQSRSIGYSVTPNFCSKTFTWKSSDESIATVDNSGKVTPKKEGTATITATATDGSGVSGSCKVTVTSGYTYDVFSSTNDVTVNYAYTTEASESFYVYESYIFGKRTYEVSSEYKSESDGYQEIGSYYGGGNSGTRNSSNELHVNFTGNKYCKIRLVGTYGSNNHNNKDVQIIINGNPVDYVKGYMYNNNGDGCSYEDETYINCYGYGYDGYYSYYDDMECICLSPGTTCDLVIKYAPSGSLSHDKAFLTWPNFNIETYTPKNLDDVISANNISIDVVKVSRDGILGAEALKIHDNLTDFSGLKVVGPLDEYDWKTIAEMKVKYLDLTEASGVYPSFDMVYVQAVKLSSNIKEISRNYFPNANYVYIPEGVTNITSYVGTTRGLLTLEGCKGVKSIANSVFSRRNVYGDLSFDNLEFLGNDAFSRCNWIKNVKMPKLKSISDNAFADCTSLYSVSIGDDAIIGCGAFANCYSLKNINLNKVIKIGSAAFRNCTMLSSINASNLSELGEYAFSNCTGLTTVVAPKLKTIPPFAFYNSKMTSATFAEADTIGKYAFALANANSISCKKVRYVDNGAFSQVYKYNVERTNYWGDTYYYVEESANNNIVGKIDIPSVEVICDSAFYRQSDIETLVTPKLKKVGEYAFASKGDYWWSSNSNVANKLKSIDLSSVKEIGNSAFYNCINLLDVNLANVQSIGAIAFYNCDKLTNVSIPNVTKINGNTFYDCDGIKSLDAPRVTSIGETAFSGCDALETINILKADSIGNSAFSGCGKLQQVKLPNIASLGSSAFYNCSSVKDIELSDKLTALGENSFYGCTGVEALTLPASIQKIPSNCFAGSNNIKTINCNAPAPPAVGETPFNMQTLYTATLYVPEQSIGLYQADTYWKHFYYYDTNPDVLTDLILSNVTDMGDVRMEKVNLTMNIGSCLSMSGNAAQSFRSVTFKANNTGSGMFISTSERISSDATKIDFDMAGLTWYFVSLPYDVNVADIERSVESAQLAIYKYDGSKRASSGTGYAWTRVNSGTLTAGTGYIIQTSKATTLTFPASYAQKDKSFQPYDVTTKLSANTSTTAANQGWNFVGNPYLAYYDIAKLGFNAPITVWTGSTYTAYSPSDDEYVLKPMQPFFVQCPTNVKSIKFNADGRQATATIAKPTEVRAKVGTRNENRKVMDIAIYSGNDAEDDHTRLVVNKNATDDYELTCDAAKMMSLNENVAQVYTVSRGIQYSINEGPQLTGKVAVGILAPKAGKYTFKAVRSDIDVMLHDAMTGETVNLSEGDYTFETEKGVNESRFSIILGTEATAITGLNVDDTADDTEVYDLNGRRTSEPAKGVNIIRQNGKVSKQMNR